MVYEELKKACLGYNAWASHRSQDQAALSSLQISLIGAASKLAATVSTYPLQARPCRHSDWLRTCPWDADRSLQQAGRDPVHLPPCRSDDCTMLRGNGAATSACRSLHYSLHAQVAGQGSRAFLRC